MNRALIACVASVALLAGACSKDETATPSPSSSHTLGPSAAPAGYKALTSDRAPSSTKPTIVIPGEAPPKTLQITDLTVGAASEASATSTVTVNYHLVTWEDGTEVDSSFGGQPLTSPLSGLVAGWKQGIPGMKVGGRRQLIIPPELGYGTDPTTHELGGKTLVFIIDLLSVS